MTPLSGRKPTGRFQIRINLLDGFQLWHDRAALVTPLSVQRVLALLALQSCTLRRGYVAGVLWPATTEEHAGANLRSALWRANRSGLRLTDTTRTDLRLVSSVTVDVHEMLAAVERVRQPARFSDPTGVDLSNLTGDLLPGWYDDWVVMERERLRQIQLRALEAMSRSLIATRAFDRAVMAALAAVTIEPLRESANRILIEAYLAERNVADAILQYRRYRSLLADELGVHPSFGLSESADDVQISMTSR
jgi:DNA-binding SARP family transcriptional activator